MFAALACFVSAAIDGFLTALYFIARIPHTPLSPNAAHGYVFPYNNHGVVHYVTWFDHLIDTQFGYVAFICVPLGILGVVSMKIVAAGKERSESTDI